MNDLVTFVTSSVEIHTPTVGVVIAAILVCLLLYVSGFASGSEIAFFSLSPNDIDELEPTKSSTDKNIQILRDDSERTLATILILNNLVNVTIVMLSGFVLREVVEFKVAWVEILCATVLLTFLLLLFGEIMPKVYSSMNPLRFCRHAVGGIMVARKLFWPIENVLMRSSILAEKMLKQEKRKLSMDEIEQALELTNKNEISNEQEMLEGIIRFVDETAKEVMTSRRDIVDLDIRSNYAEVLKCIVENNYSRIPVYQDNEDNIRGILYIKDLMEHIKNNELDIPIKQFIRSAYFVPETKSIIEILKEFRGLKVHIAMVLDEYGGVVGLVTIEDLIEEIVGEIRDEYDDEEESFFKKVADNEYEVDAMTDIETINKDLELNLPISEDYESLGGLIVTTTGKICEVGDEVQIDNIYLKVLEVDKMRVSKVFIRILEEVKEEE